MEYQFVICGPIGVGYDWWTGQSGTTAKAVRNFLAAHKDEEVHIAVSSPGGDVAQGLEIYDAIKNHGKVCIHVVGMTASAATFLCMGAKSIDMADGSLMLIHNASTIVSEWESANKDELDKIIAKYQALREDLNTVDRVIASLYASRTGKSVEDCMAKMSRAAWLSPQDALDFGLIDSIRSDAALDATKNKLRNFSNNIFKEYGLPPIPTAANPVADENGEPTKTFLQKTVEAVVSFFRNEPALILKPKMIKIFKNVMGLLDITDGFKANEDGTVSLSQEQLQTIEDHLAAQDTEIADLKAARDKAEGDLKDAQAELATANETITNLKKAPGATTRPVTDNAEQSEDKFLAEARASFNRINDI